MTADDDVVTLESQIALYRTLPHGELAVVPGGSHMLLLEKPRSVTALVRDFLQEAPRALGAPVLGAEIAECGADSHGSKGMADAVFRLVAERLGGRCRTCQGGVEVMLAPGLRKVVDQIGRCAQVAGPVGPAHPGIVGLDQEGSDGRILQIFGEPSDQG